MTLYSSPPVTKRKKNNNNNARNGTKTKRQVHVPGKSNGKIKRKRNYYYKSNRTRGLDCRPLMVYSGVLNGGNSVLEWIFGEEVLRASGSGTTGEETGKAQVPEPNQSRDSYEGFSARSSMIGGCGVLSGQSGA